MGDGLTHNHVPVGFTPPDGGTPPVETPLIAGEFNTQEELVTAYQALVAKNAETPVTTPPADPPAVDPNVTPDAASTTLENVGLSMDEFQSEFTLNGELSEASFAKLEAAGIPKGMVDGYIEAMGIKAASMETEVYNMVGGEDSYAAMSSWAAQSLSPAELNAFNTVVTGNDFDAAKIAIQGLNAKYGAATGRTGNLLQGTPPSNVGDTFNSNAELVTAMSDPRYKRDPAYRAEVRTKLSRSPIL